MCSTVLLAAKFRLLLDDQNGKFRACPAILIGADRLICSSLNTPSAESDDVLWRFKRSLDGKRKKTKLMNFNTDEDEDEEYLKELSTRYKEASRNETGNKLLYGRTSDYSICIAVAGHLTILERVRYLFGQNLAEITLEELLKKIGNDLRLYEEDIITKYVLRYKGRDDTLSEFQRGKFNGEMRLLAEKQGVSYEQIENMFVEFFEDHGFSEVLVGVVPLANNTSGSLRLFTLRSALGEDGYRVGKEYDKNLVTIGIEARVVKEQMKNAGCTNALVTRERGDMESHGAMAIKEGAKFQKFFPKTINEQSSFVVLHGQPEPALRLTETAPDPVYVRIVKLLRRWKKLINRRFNPPTEWPDRRCYTE